MRIRCLFLLALQLWFKWAFSQPQVLHRDTTILFSGTDQASILQMGGLLDANNTFTHPNGIAFQHMQSVRISNRGNKIVNHPRLVINSKRNWFDIQSLRMECFGGAVTSKEKALSLWQFMRNNRLHYNEPDYGLESDDPIKLLGSYGYGTCYNTSYATAFVAAVSPVVGQPYRAFAPRDKHSLKDIRFDSVFMLIDPDIEVFYLNRENTQLATFNEVVADKDLIRRTHHYGKSSDYNYSNGYIANGIYEPTNARYTGYVTNFHSLDFSLRPGESIEYSWAPAKYYHHRVPWSTHNAPLDDLGNGKFIYATNFNNADLEEILDGFENVATSSGGKDRPNIYAKSAKDSATFIINVTSPFVIVNAQVDLSFIRKSRDSYLAVAFSKDSIQWETVWQSDLIGHQFDSFSLYANIDPTANEAIYHYYLKVFLFSTDKPQNCGIDSIRIATDFQVNRFFLPSLELGENSISYSDSDTSQYDEKQVSIHFKWHENHGDVPPPAIPLPVFPSDESIVDDLKFTFVWEPPLANGIIDYEFILSDRPDLKFPLSPSFEVYTSAVNAVDELAQFTIPFDGMLNSGTKYYWKVRGKNTNGIWSEWSPIWSFIPLGPMPPTLLTPLIGEDTILLRWHRNNEGTSPAYYEVHASNEASGFTPNQYTLMDTTSANFLEFSASNTIPKTFYRIVAVSDNQRKSGLSNTVAIPYPYVYEKPPVVLPNQPYVITLNTNEVHFTEAFDSSPFFTYLTTPDEIAITLLSGPAWISIAKQPNLYLVNPAM